MRDFNRFSKILWRFWPCFFCPPSFRHFREGFYWESAKKIFREGEPDRTEGEGESRTETEWEGKRRNAPGKNTYGGTVPVLSERSFWPMKKRRGPPGRKKILGRGQVSRFSEARPDKEGRRLFKSAKKSRRPAEAGSGASRKKIRGGGGKSRPGAGESAGENPRPGKARPEREPQENFKTAAAPERGEDPAPVPI